MPNGERMVMMKRKKRALISAMLLIMGVCMFSIPASANQMSGQRGLLLKDENNNEKSAVSYCQSFVDSTSTYDSSTPWNKATKVKEVIRTYDVDGSVNAYIMNLKNANGPAGYVFIKPLSKSNFKVEEFGYSGVYSIENKKITATAYKDKIIYAGFENFFTKRNTKYYRLGAESIKQQIAYDEKNVRDISFKSMKIERENLKVQEASIENNALADAPHHEVKNLDRFSPYTMNEFVDVEPYPLNNHCEVTAGMNLLKYWAVSRGVVPLFINYDKSVSFTNLKNCMCHTYLGGTADIIAYKGLWEYLVDNDLKLAAGNDFRDHNQLNWKIIQTEINNNIPFIMCAESHDYDPKAKGRHAFFAVGYQNRSEDCYVRVVDEWNTATDHFYNYTYTNVADLWYYRW